MTILAIDTSTNVLGVSLLKEGNIIGEHITNVKKNHAIRVMPAVEELCKECDVTPKEFTKIVVSQGPGSYTGVRMGVTIAKSLAWTLQIELAGVSSLEVVAQNAKQFEGFIVPIIDARRGQVFAGIYQNDHEKTKVVMEDQLLLLDQLLDTIKEKNVPAMFLGTDLPMHKEKIQAILGDLYVEAPKTYHLPRPSELALLGEEKEAENVHTFVPQYLRLAEAEANWLKGQQSK